MAFSPWQILSPVQWAKWTWSAVRGGGGSGETEEVPDEDDSQAEDKSLNYSSDSEGHFETPEAETPIRSLEKELPLEADHPDPGLDSDEQLVAEVPFKSVLQDDIRLQQDKEQALLIQQSCNSNQESLLVDSSISSLSAPRSVETDPSVGMVLKSQAQAEFTADLNEQFLETDVSLAIQNKDIADKMMVVPSEETASVLSQSEAFSLDVPSIKKKSTKHEPHSLRKTVPENAESCADQSQTAVPKATYSFNTDNPNELSDPFASRGSLEQNSFQDSKKNIAEESILRKDTSAEVEQSTVKPESDLAANKENADLDKSLPKKALKKPASRLATRKHIPVKKVAAPENAENILTSSGVDDIPIPKSNSNFDSNKWDDPNFNPFGGTRKMQNSPLASKSSYNFDPDNFDDSVDPFKPSKTLSNVADMGPQADQFIENLKPGKCDLSTDEGKTVTALPKKSNSRIITNSCKVKTYENDLLLLDVASQDEEIVTTSKTDITQRDGHATDEEKLASNTSTQKSAVPEVKGFEKQPVKEVDEDIPITHCDITLSPVELSSGKSVVSPESEKESPLDNIPLSEADKVAVLALIREEIITKEFEASEWKRKYEESRQEVLEMRNIVAEYENTIAQMIEDEQRTRSSSQKTLQQMTAEKDQAIADLNSVERSLSDLFRRYENMKGVLEGFKKNEEALKKCAEDYLARVKQEEQRYQALKMHAEEKLDKANEEIAQVRTKANAEGTALRASLRKEQMKVESLEMELKQKKQEIDELTKICDELIAKVGKSD
ncbi:transforming acidic coiled-coil-containing protein 1 isoform X2 [Protopterus annectens]|uniref:transforming acidic coiled-coil-containing protein 1 isoform X2 n=1 Tax=Protopterus annectens TaxID=7888 RepID=UPI001CFB7935|nr:transforming acidic coiled-coil-containing protein 1 isoform X2 [Protopterus annectens]